MAERMTVTVEEIRLRNFRAFENARLRLSDLTFLVGRNGAGKSSLLDAIALLQEAVSDSLENALDRRGGLNSVRRMSAGGDLDAPLGLALAMSILLPGRAPVRVVYGFELVSVANAPYRIVERLATSAISGGFERTGGDFHAPGNRLDPVPPDGRLMLPLIGRSDSLWNQILDSIRGLRTYALSPAHMAEAREIGERTTLLCNGANAGDVLKALPEAECSWLLERLALITEGIVRVEGDALYGRRVLRFRQQQGEAVRTLEARQVSQGTLAGLGVLLALRQQPIPSVVLIDEIENSLHASALGVLLDAAQASCARMRVVLTTHSPEVLSHSAVTADRVRVVEWRDGTSQVFRLSPETQAAVNTLDTVGELLRSNALWTGPEPETCGDDLFALEL
ncbi:AAA family ATPase [uncultured Thiodictyon sp.]|jgi:predicted ATPase|uniref:AAA family ATPase n=1 Tax=uncultured Thiodictyon sp. TaxID=1846217 RepID=UPI0025F4D1B1|nr:AAA family ATPase [uncultured Thiodictyon sp.]